MKRLTLVGTLGIALLATGLVGAQQPAGKPDPAQVGPQGGKPAKAAAKPSAGRGMGPGGGMMNGGMRGLGMKGGGMMCQGMFQGGDKVEVTKLPKGVTITITSEDASAVARIQKQAEAMKLMHEAHAQ